jgi:hypothetical protein
MTVTETPFMVEELTMEIPVSRDFQGRLSPFEEHMRCHLKVHSFLISASCHCIAESRVNRTAE